MSVAVDAVQRGRKLRVSDYKESVVPCVGAFSVWARRSCGGRLGTEAGGCAHAPGDIAARSNSFAIARDGRRYAFGHVIGSDADTL